MIDDDPKHVEAAHQAAIYKAAKKDEARQLEEALAVSERVEKLERENRRLKEEVEELELQVINLKDEIG